MYSRNRVFDTLDKTSTIPGIYFAFDRTAWAAWSIDAWRSNVFVTMEQLDTGYATDLLTDRLMELFDRSIALQTAGIWYLIPVLVYATSMNTR